MKFINATKLYRKSGVGAPVDRGRDRVREQARYWASLYSSCQAI
jgi:hypothetical protein